MDKNGLGVVMGTFGKPLIPVIGYGGATYGSAFLKSLQTEKLPELDLLVRESVQNSSDASISIEHKNFWIDYTFSEFDTSCLLAELGEVGELLQGKVANAKYFLEIRDSKTSGLTGPYDKDELVDSDHGNYFKLVFDTGINQTQQGAGGNWGFGKSVYYRVSNAGVVVYYTRIYDEITDAYEERLIATMVENEADDLSVLRKIVDNPTGRAWWGRSGMADGIVWPVVDHHEIVAFLKMFDLEPFGETETGTSVIIPFIDEDKLLGDVLPSDGISDDEIERCTWRQSVPKYLEHSLQKWYAPRLRNKELEALDDGSKWIRAKVNGSLLKNDEAMNPFFKLVQELYTTALFKCKGRSYISMTASIKCKEISIRSEGLVRESVGYVAYVKIKSKELYGPSAGISPYILTGNFINSEDENEPIVMFAREPGMVITYSIDGTWSGKVKAPAKNAGSSEDEYIFAFYVPRVDNEFVDSETDDRRALYGNLGGYLRKCEESDHASWEDKAKFRIISKIRNNAGRKIAEGTHDDILASVSASASRLSGRVGKALMPGKNAFSKPNKPRGGGGGGTGSSGGSGISFTTFEPHWQKDCLIVPFEMGMGIKTCREMRIEVQTEAGTMSPEAWAKDIGTRFPAEIVSASVSLEKKDGTGIGIMCTEVEHERVEAPLKGLLVDRGGLATVFLVECEVLGQLLVGNLTLRSSDKTIECVIKAV